MTSRPLKIIAVLVLSFAVYPLWAQETCAIRGEGNSFKKCIVQTCSTEERTRSVVFPDGRVLWVVGHDHTNRDELMDELLTLRDKNASAAEIRKKLAEILAENKIAAQNAQLDVEFLKRFLFLASTTAEHPKPRYEIGVEALSEDVPALRSDLNQLREYFSSQKEFSHEDRRDSEQVLLTVFGPQLYLETTQSGLFRSSSVRGFEADSPLRRAREVENSQRSAFQTLLEKYKSNSEVLVKLHESRRYFIQLAENFDPAKDSRAIMNTAREADWSVSNDRKAEILNWVKAEINLLNARRGRDRAVADRMVKSKNRQLLFVGSMHLNSLARFIREECLKEMIAEGVRSDQQIIRTKPLPPRPLSGGTTIQR